MGRFRSHVRLPSDKKRCISWNKSVVVVCFSRFLYSARGEAIGRRLMDAISGIQTIASRARGSFSNSCSTIPGEGQSRVQVMIENRNRNPDSRLPSCTRTYCTRSTCSSSRMCQSHIQKSYVTTGTSTCTVQVKWVQVQVQAPEVQKCPIPVYYWIKGKRRTHKILLHYCNNNIITESRSIVQGMFDVVGRICFVICSRWNQSHHDRQPGWSGKRW